MSFIEFFLLLCFVQSILLAISIQPIREQTGKSDYLAYKS